MHKDFACNSVRLVLTLSSGLRSVGEMERGGENREFVGKEDMREGGGGCSLVLMPVFLL